MEKKTIKEMYEEIVATYELSDEHKAFLLDRAAKSVRKSSGTKAPSKKTLENREFTVELLTYLRSIEGEATAADLANHFGKSTNSVASLITNAKKNGEEIKSHKIKGRTYYSIN